MKELSASALQILEKRERMDTMLILAEQITYSQIKDAQKKNSKLSDRQIIDLIQEEGIPKYGFLHEYVIRVSVHLSTAKEYYGHFTMRLNPDFIEFDKDRKPHFHLAEWRIGSVLNEFKAKEEKGNE